jgi:hypothetical protein
MMESAREMTLLSTPQACMMWGLVIKHSENPIYLFPEMKLLGLVPNSYIHVPVSDLNIPRISLPIWLQQSRKTDYGICLKINFGPNCQNPEILRTFSSQEYTLYKSTHLVPLYCEIRPCSLHGMLLTMNIQWF